MMAELLALADWLESLHVVQIAMESTGVFWHPVYNVLEEGRTLLLVNPQHIKALPGRKTDVKDSEWIADLFRHGLLKASFVPPKPIRELRELTRYRKTLIQEPVQEINRLQKVLEGANLKLAAVASDVLGVSGRRMLRAIIAGKTDAEDLAQLKTAHLHATREQLAETEQVLDARYVDVSADRPDPAEIVEIRLPKLDASAGPFARREFSIRIRARQLR